MRVLIIEDDRVVSDTLKAYLELSGYDVEVAADGPSGLARAVRDDIDVVVLDVMIPGLNGLEVCRRLRAVSAVPLVMVTARTSEDDRLRGFATGADDYVPKPFSPREVVARVDALLRRRPAQPGPPPTVTVGDLVVNLWAHEARVCGRALPLTATEFRLLAALAGHAGRVLTRAELVARAFGPDYDGLDRTIDAHITNLRRKIADAPRDGDDAAGRAAQYVVTVHGVGYRLATADDR